MDDEAIEEMDAADVDWRATALRLSGALRDAQTALQDMRAVGVAMRELVDELRIREVLRAVEVAMRELVDELRNGEGPVMLGGIKGSEPYRAAFGMIADQIEDALDEALDGFPAPAPAGAGGESGGR